MERALKQSILPSWLRLYAAVLMVTLGIVTALHGLRMFQVQSQQEAIAQAAGSRVPAIALGATGVFLLAVGLAIARQSLPSWRVVSHRLHEDRATSSVSFILTLPIFLLLVAIIIQSALIANAQLMVNYAAFVAARSAATSLPDGKTDHPRRAAALALAPLSPIGPSTAAGRQAREALLRAGASLPRQFDGRYGHAFDAVSIIRPSLSDRSRSASEKLEMEITYRFILKIPGANRILKAGRTTFGGVSGRYILIHGHSTFQSSPGRDRIEFGF